MVCQITVDGRVSASSQIISFCLSADGAPTAICAMQMQRVTQILQSCRDEELHMGQATQLLHQNILRLLQSSAYTNPAFGHEPGGSLPSWFLDGYEKWKGKKKPKLKQGESKPFQVIITCPCSVLLFSKPCHRAQSHFPAIVIWLSYFLKSFLVTILSRAMNVQVRHGMMHLLQVADGKTHMCGWEELC